MPRNGVRFGRGITAAVLGLAGVAMAFHAATGDGPTARAAVASQPCVYLTPGDGVLFTNYDFLTTANPSCVTVDWATSMLFANGGTINLVKDVMDPPLTYAGDTMNMVVRDGASAPAYKDGDGGKKEVPCPTTGRWTRHYRIYADADDYLWAASMGPFVVGTTHKDTNECPPINKHHYDSEYVEKYIADLMQGMGYAVYRDYANFQNYEPLRVEGDHSWINNGYATYFDMYPCTACR